MLLRILVIIFTVFAAMLNMFGTAYGQNYPTKPIHVLVGSVTGANGIAARLIAQATSGPLGQQVVVENRGSGFGPQEQTAKASPDGYTITVSGSSLWIAPLTQKTPYDAVKDFAPISLVAITPLVLYVTPALPAKSVSELIALAKAKPGELNFTIGGLGGTTHLAGELFKSMAGINFVLVPYNDGNQEMTDLISGRVQLTIAPPGSLMEQARAGKLRVIAVTSAQPSPLGPGLPTMAASGLPGYEATQSIGMLAPANTPVAIINRLNQETVRYLKAAETKQQFFEAGLDTVGSSAEELAAKMRSDIARWGKVVKDAGIKTE